MPATLAALLIAGVARADDPPALAPLLTVPGEAVLETAFDRPVYQLPKSTWAARQGTQWRIAGGVLSGTPSSKEYQAKRTHHRGLEPRLSIPPTPAEFAARFSIRFLEGEETDIVPFVEFGHHVIRLRFDRAEGVTLLADHESVKLAEDRSWLYEPGRWIHLYAELKGEDFVIQIADGPTLHATHPVLSQPNPSGGNGVGVAGTRGGTVEIDNLAIWEIGEEPAPGWKERKGRFPVFEPVVVREKPEK